jgi:MFS family permease
MTSLCTEYWQLFLAQGICGGLGAGISYTPVLACVSTYFTRKKALAISVTTCGSVTGGVVFPVIARQLLDKIGFAWTVRVMGFVMLFNSVLIVILAKARLPPRKRGPLVEVAAFREASYTLFSIGAFMLVWGVYVSYYYVSPGPETQADCSLMIECRSVTTPPQSCTLTDQPPSSSCS